MCWTDWQTKCRKIESTVNWYQHLQNITTVRTDLSNVGDGFCPQSKTHRACKEDRSFLPFRLNITLSCPLLSLIGSISSRCFENEPPLILSKELFSGSIKDWTWETAVIEPRLPWVPEVVFARAAGAASAVRCVGVGWGNEKPGSLAPKVVEDHSAAHIPWPSSDWVYEMLTSVLSDNCKLQGLWHAATPSCLAWWTREDWVQAKCHSSLAGNSVVFTVEATVDQCLAVGTTYTYQIMQIQTWPVVVDSAAPISSHLDSIKHSWLVMSTSLLQITRYLDSDSSDDKPTKKIVRIIVKTDVVIDRMANSESNKMMQNFFVLHTGMNVLAVIR